MELVPHTLLILRNTKFWKKRNQVREYSNRNLAQMNKIITSLRYSTVFPYKLQERGLLGRMRNVKLIEWDCRICTEDTSGRERSSLAVLGYVYNELTSWSKAFLQALTVPQLVKKYHALYGTQRSLSAFARARHLSLSTASWIQSMPHQFDRSMIVLVTVSFEYVL
jgi:hypothetical protein